MRVLVLGRSAIACLLVAGCGSSSLPVDRRAADGATFDDASVAADAASSADATPAQTDRAVIEDALSTPDLLDGASFAVSWGVQWFGSPAPVGCAQARTPTVVLRMTDRSNQVFVDRFSCSALKGQTRQLAPGPYLFDMSIEDERGQRLGYSMWHLDLVAGQTNDLGLQGFEVQSFAVSWALTRGGQPLTCAAAGAKSVELVAMLGAEAVTHTFPCGDGSGGTKAVPQGKYVVEMRLIGADGAVLAKTPSVPVDAGDEKRATVPPISFQLP
jgi:hypothetical protein